MRTIIKQVCMILIISFIFITSLNFVLGTDYNMNGRMNSFYDVNTLEEYNYVQGSEITRDCGVVTLKRSGRIAKEGIYYFVSGITKAGPSGVTLPATLNLNLIYLFNEGDKTKIIKAKNPEVVINGKMSSGYIGFTESGNWNTLPPTTKVTHIKADFKLSEYNSSLQDINVDRGMDQNINVAVSDDGPIVLPQTQVTTIGSTSPQGTNKDNPIIMDASVGRFYDPKTFKMYGNMGSNSEECPEINLKDEKGNNPGEGFYYYVSDRIEGNPTKLKLSGVFVFKDNGVFKWINTDNTIMKIDDKEINLNNYEDNVFEDETTYKIEYTNYIIKKGKCISNMEELIGHIDLNKSVKILDATYSIYVRVGPNKIGMSLPECPEDKGYLNPCREGQLICMENICGIKKLINDFIQLKVPDQNGLSYTELYQNSLDSSISGKALYEEALGYKKLAQIKKEYEQRAISSKPQNIDTTAQV